MGFLDQPLSFLSIPPTRSFAGISGYVTLSENTTDILEITQHPVQQGASISDHAYKRPVVLTIQFIKGSNRTQNLAAIYQSLLALQQPGPATGPALLPAGVAGPQLQNAAPIPTINTFSVTTPKRTYYNMLLASLGCVTDKRTENVLSINATFQEVIIVPITTTNVPASQLSNAGSNQGTQNVGQKSFIKTLIGGP